jgi:predicted small lipoprotein YifL
MKTIFRLFLLLASLWTLSGCGLPGAESYPTPIPPEVLPTAIYQTASAANATMFASTPSVTPTFTLEPPTPTVTVVPTITFTPTGIPPAPNALIQVEAPGPMSLLASPLHLRMYVVAGETGIVQIALYGELSGLLGRELFRVQAIPPTAGYVTMKIPFQVRAVEYARLEVSTKDRSGRTEALTSVHLTLLPDGPSQINPPPPPFERAAIYEPVSDAVISGGVVAVTGAIWPLNKNPVILELVDEKGKILNEKILSLTGDTYVPFTATVPYTVYEPTNARLMIRQADDRFNGALIYLYSLLVTLNP